MKSILTIIAVSAFFLMSFSLKEAYNIDGISTNYQKGKELVINVDGICSMCRDRVEAVVMNMEGVNNAVWDIKTKQLRVNYDSSKTSSDKISKEIARVEHNTEYHRAHDRDYNSLHGCRQYRRR